MTGQEIKIHLFNRRTNNIACSHSKGNGSNITVEEFKKAISENNTIGLCEHCMKYLKSSKGRLVG